jgi:hypothetical protein
MVDNIMSEKKTETNYKTGGKEVSFDELSYSNMMSIEALFRVLERKGIVTQREVLDELVLVKHEMSGKAS